MLLLVDLGFEIVEDRLDVLRIFGGPLDRCMEFNAVDRDLSVRDPAEFAEDRIVQVGKNFVDRFFLFLKLRVEFEFGHVQLL